MDWVASSFDCNVAGYVAPCSSAAVYAIPPSELINSFTDPTLMMSLLAVQCFNATGIGVEADMFGNMLFGLISWDDRNDTPDDFPDPFNHSYMDWIITGNLTFSQGIVGAGGFTGGTANADGWVRAKAKRRLGNQKGLLLSVFNDSVETIAWKFYGRFLIKE